MTIKKVGALILIIVITGVGIQLMRVYDWLPIFPINSLGFSSVDNEQRLFFEPPEEYFNISVLYLSTGEVSSMLKENLYHALRMAKIRSDFYDLDNPEGKDIQDIMDNTDLLVVASVNSLTTDQSQKIREWVSKGGRTAFLAYFPEEELYDVVGIVESRGYFTVGVSGLNIVGNIFPGLDEIERTDVVQTSLDVDLAASAKVLVESESKSPLVWTNSYYSGEIVFINTTTILSKNFRGFLLSCISKVKDYFVFTILNSLVFQIDDFPAPIKLDTHPAIYDYYRISTPEFFRRIWWPATYNFARRHRLNLTGLAIVTFNDDTVSPLSGVNEIEREQLQYFGRRLSEFGGELGIHGYNHQSLALEGQMYFEKYGYNPWESEQTMEEGLRILKETLENTFGSTYIFTYVPPSNIISPEGRKAIKRVFPEMRVFAGLYSGASEKGLLLQEFGRDPYVPEVISFPRNSSGYLYRDDMMWNIFDLIANYGLVNHFIHPDDLFDPARSGGYSWEEMDRQINRIFTEIRSHFPFLRGMKTIEAYKYFMDSENIDVFSRREGDYLYIQYSASREHSIFHMLRLRDERIASIEGGKYNLISYEHGLYLIESTADMVRIRLN